MLDDTCYFIPCSSSMEAALLSSLLNDPLCLDFIHAIMFLNAKRPITKKLLQRIDLTSLFYLVEREVFALRVTAELEKLGVQQQIQWASIEDFFVKYFLKEHCTDPAQNRISTMQQLTLIP